MAAGAAAGAPDKGAELRAAAVQARDGDMQADWNKMLDARERFTTLAADEELAPLAHYYLYTRTGGCRRWRTSQSARAHRRNSPSAR